MAYANQCKLSALRASARESDSDRKKAITEHDCFRELLAEVEKRVEAAERKAELAKKKVEMAEAHGWEKD